MSCDSVFKFWILHTALIAFGYNYCGDLYLSRLLVTLRAECTASQLYVYIWFRRLSCTWTFSRFCFCLIINVQRRHQTTNRVRSWEVGQRLLRGQFIEHKVKAKVKLEAPRLTRRPIDRTCSEVLSSTCSLCSCCCWCMKCYHCISHQ